MKTRTLILTLVLSTSSLLKAQVDAIGDFFGSGVDNAEKLFESYFAPWTNALGASLNGGWYNSAKSHELGGFDLTVTFNAAFIPASDKTFDLTGLGLQNVLFPDGSEAATIAGSKDGGKTITYIPNSDYPGASVNISSPNGTGLPLMATPMIQVGIGLIKETEVDVRFFPRANIGDFGSIGLWGVGLKHGIKQHIPGLSKVPVLQLTLQGGYTKFSSNFDISVTPAVYGLPDPGTYDNQEMSLIVKSFTMNILVGASLPVVDFYGGLGFATTKANIDLTGTFPVPTVTLPGGSLGVTDYEDPISVETRNSDGTKAKPRMNVGMRFKMGVVTFHIDYTKANYSIATAGLGISFR